MEWIVVLTVVAAVAFIILVLRSQRFGPVDPCQACGGSGIEHSAVGWTYHVRCSSCDGTGHT